MLPPASVGMAVVTTTRAVVRRVAIPRVARPRAVPPRTILPHIVTPPPTSPIGRPPHGQTHVSNASVYQDGIFALKLGLSACVGAAITLAVLNNLEKRPGITGFRPDASGSSIYNPSFRKEPAALTEETNGPDRLVPSNFPRKVRTVMFTPPAHLLGSPPAPNPLAGKPLRYLIGTKASGPGRDDEVTEVSYAAAPAKRGISIAYCNLFDELNTGRYGPYLHTSNTAKKYHEGQIHPRGPGWEKNLREQFERRRKQGFTYIELDNPDAYRLSDVLRAIALAQTYGFKVVAKNPGAMNEDPTPYVAHPNIYGIIVEKDAGETREGDATPAEMDALRKRAGKPELPVWFVSFGKGRAWASSVAAEIRSRGYHNMSVTYSNAGECGNSIDILRPSKA
jgi:hypothetical protein